MVGENIGKLHHSTEVLFGEGAAILRRQLTRQCVHDLFAVLGPLFLQDLPVDPLADLPIQQGRRGVDGHCDLLVALLD